MPIESAVYLNTLVATNPVHTDGLSQTDSHLRLLKTVLQSTFPNISGPVSATDTDLSAVAGFVNNGTVTVSAPTGSSTVGGEVILNGGTGQTSLTLQNSSSNLALLSGTTQVGTLTAAGALALAGPVSGSLIQQAGNTLLPTGMIVMWSGSVASIPAGWHLCDGTNGTPPLQDAFIVAAGLNYAPGASGGFGTQTATTSTAGSHSHSGVTGLAGAHTPSVAIDTQGSHSHGAATQGHALTIGELPSHDHGMGAPIGLPAGIGSFQLGTSGTGYSGVTFLPQGGGQTHSHPISTDGAHSHNATASAVGNHQHSIAIDGNHSHSVSFDNRPPFYALCYIMKT